MNGGKKIPHTHLQLSALDPGNHESTFCFCKFAISGHFVWNLPIKKKKNYSRSVGWSGEVESLTEGEGLEWELKRQDSW